MANFRKQKQTSPALQGISNNGMATETTAYDRWAIIYNIPLSRVYGKESTVNCFEFHHVRKIVKEERTGQIVSVPFGTEEEFCHDILDGEFDSTKKWNEPIGDSYRPRTKKVQPKFKMTHEMHCAIGARSVGYEI